MIVDPATGSGAYMISAGLSGGWLDLDRLSKDLLWASYMFLSLALILAFPFAMGVLLAWCLSFAYLLANLALNGADQVSTKDYLILVVDLISSTALLGFMGLLSGLAVSIPIVLCLGLIMIIAVGLSYLLNRVVINQRIYSERWTLC